MPSDATVDASIGERLGRLRASLTPTERRVAELVVDDSTVLAFATVAELAERAGTSGPTIVRFATKLGFAGYSELQQHARDAVTAQLRPVDRSRSSTAARGRHTSWTTLRDASLDTVERVFDGIDPATLDEMARAIARARGHVWVVTSETSSPVAPLLVSNLRLIRAGVRHLTGSSAALASELVDASDRDVVVAIDAERYERSVSDIVDALAARGVSIVAITDGPMSPLATSAGLRCDVDVPAIGPFDSAVPIVIVAELLTAAVARHCRRTATHRLESIEAAWSASDVFADAGDSTR